MKRKMVKKPEAKEIVDEEEKVDEMQDPNTGVVGDDSMIHDYLDEGGYDSNYEEDDTDSVNEEFLTDGKN